jgi:hypothetical protein
MVLKRVVLVRLGEQSTENDEEKVLDSLGGFLEDRMGWVCVLNHVKRRKKKKEGEPTEKEVEVRQYEQGEGVAYRYECVSLHVWAGFMDMFMPEAAKLMGEEKWTVHEACSKLDYLNGTCV